MPVQSQYYPVGAALSADLKGFLSNSAIEYKEIGVHENRLSLLLHAPFSPLHVLRGELPEDALQLKSREGGSMSLLSTGENLYLPKCPEVESEQLNAQILSGLQRRAHLKNSQQDRQIKELYSESDNSNHFLQSEILAFLSKYSSNTNPLYGEYLPGGSSLYPNNGEGVSVDPAKFLVAYLLEVSNKHIEAKHAGKLELVFHPDTIYFLGRGDLTTGNQIAKDIGVLCSVLNLYVYYENVIFDKQTFKEAFGWMENPTFLADLLIGAANSGVCIDTQHLERAGYSFAEISNLIKHTFSVDRDVVIHTSDQFNVENRPYLYTAYQLGLQVAYESRGQ